jgi:hypothetical protein
MTKAAHVHFNNINDILLLLLVFMVYIYIYIYIYIYTIQTSSNKICH